jgi:hypothetical protein
MTPAQSACLTVSLCAGRSQREVLAAAIKRALVAYKNTEHKKS